MTSRDPEKSSRDQNTLKVQYLENSWRCYLATIANTTRYDTIESLTRTRKLIIQLNLAHVATKQTKPVPNI